MRSISFGDAELPGALEPLHPGFGFAIPFLTLFAVAVGVYLIMGPLFVVSYTVNLRHPATGQEVTCHVALAPGFDPGNYPSDGVAVCGMSCRLAGFEAVQEDPPLPIYDYVWDGYERMQKRWMHVIPIPCRPDWARTQ